MIFIRWKHDKKKDEYKLDKSMQPWFLKLMVFCQCMAIILFNFYAFSMLYLIMLRGTELGAWTIPLILLHMFFLGFLAGWLQFRKVKREQHMILGDELYYREYPLDLWLLERQLAWKKAMKTLENRPRLQRTVLSLCVAVASGKPKRRRFARFQPYQISSSLAPLPQVLAMFGLILLCFFPLYWILLRAAVLGWGALLLLVLYLAVLASAAWLIDDHKQRLLEHGLLGDEDYYARYPVSAWLLDRHLAWHRLLRRVGHPTIEIRY